ncbi:MAG TPA: ImmA/IrrE family metallo-endopeptidase [Phycisphaerales bacterium]|nr:ImmA/IrrE family metallo-endopeptidase [Phycisphaerales bacterium]
MMKNDSYRIRVAQWEAERLWDIYGISKPDELCLEDIAFTKGVLVTEGPLQKMDARLVRKGNHGFIRVRHNIPEKGRKRFAIAHELGHWELHKKVSQIFTCTEKDFLAKYKGSPEEIEANYFAASLLMPKKLFEESMRKFPMSLATLSKLADFFLTSLTATAIRYTELSEDYCAIVCSEVGKVKWWQGSQNFRSCFWISIGQTLGNNTVAGELFNNTVSRSGQPEKVDISAWSEKNDCIDQNVFVEESIIMQRYNQVFSLLYLP